MRNHILRVDWRALTAITVVCCQFYPRSAPAENVTEIRKRTARLWIIHLR